jgi:hypothetical protein
MDWIYQNNVVSSIKDMPENVYGFIYEITYTVNGKKYIGKKNIYNERNIYLGKKEIKLLKEDNKINKKRGRVKSKKKIC